MDTHDKVHNDQRLAYDSYVDASLGRFNLGHVLVLLSLQKVLFGYLKSACNKLKMAANLYSSTCSCKVKGEALTMMSPAAVQGLIQGQLQL